MSRVHRLGILLLLISAATPLARTLPSLRSRANDSTQQKSQAATSKTETRPNEAEAFRDNTLGVAYMNQ
jgi:hypothetical protein